VFSIGYRKSGLGRWIALYLVRVLGRSTLGLGYAVTFSDLILAPATPSNTARSGGTIYPIVSNIPKIYASEPGPTARRIGTYVMWTAFAATAVTSSLFLTALAPNAAAQLHQPNAGGLRGDLPAASHRCHPFRGHRRREGRLGGLLLLHCVAHALLGAQRYRLHQVGGRGFRPAARGSLPKGDFWKFGLIFGLIYFLGLVGIVMPWLGFIH